MRGGGGGGRKILEQNKNNSCFSFKSLKVAFLNHLYEKLGKPKVPREIQSKILTA